MQDKNQKCFLTRFQTLCHDFEERVSNSHKDFNSQYGLWILITDVMDGKQDKMWSTGTLQMGIRCYRLGIAKV